MLTPSDGSADGSEALMALSSAPTRQTTKMYFEVLSKGPRSEPTHGIRRYPQPFSTTARPTEPATNDSLRGVSGRVEVLPALLRADTPPHPQGGDPLSALEDGAAGVARAADVRPVVGAKVREEYRLRGSSTGRAKGGHTGEGRGGGGREGRSRCAAVKPTFSIKVFVVSIVAAPRTKLG